MLLMGAGTQPAGQGTGLDLPRLPRDVLLHVIALAAAPQACWFGEAAAVAQPPRKAAPA
jgi:hypothetical protein